VHFWRAALAGVSVGCGVSIDMEGNLMVIEEKCIVLGS